MTNNVAKRSLSWTAGLSLVIGLGGGAMAASEDTFIPIQDPPTINILTAPLSQSFNDGASGSWEAVDRILPAASEAVVRAGFTGNAEVAEIDTNGSEPGDSDTSAEFDNTTSDDIDRVAPDRSTDSAPIYRQTITVSTNGPTDTIERVGYCLINTSDTVIRDNAQFEWYDSGDTGNVVTNDVERNCGFNDDNPAAVATPDPGSERAVISIVYDVELSSFTLENETSSQHELISTSSDATWNDDTLTIDFKFRASHGLLKQVSGWAVRAAAQDQPNSEPDGEPGTVNFSPQLSQTWWGMSEHMEGEVNSSAIDNRGDWNYASVGYYGAIVSERESVSFGTLRKDDSRVITEITTGRYIANATSEIWMEALDFKAQGAGNTVLAYKDSGSPGNNQVTYECSLEPGTGSPDTLGGDAIFLGNTPKVFANTLPFSTETNDPERSLDISAEGMSCRLMYGGGASDASEVFTNEVIVSIQDAGTAVPPFNQ